MAKSTRAPAKRENDTPPPKWKPGRFAVWSRRRPDPGNPSAITLMLRHPSAPFTAVVNDLDDRTLQSVALSYLRSAISLEIEPRLELPDNWLKALDTESRGTASEVEWLPIQWPPADYDGDVTTYAFGSFRAKRTSPRASPADQIIILMASKPVRDRPLGREVGLRVVVHACERQTNGGAGKFDIRITGLSASLRCGPDQVRGTDLPRSKSRAFLNSPLKPSSPVSGEVRLFPIDPASRGDPRSYRDRRPSRSEATLKAFCEVIPSQIQNQLAPSRQNQRTMQVGAASQFVPAGAGAQPGIAPKVYPSDPEVHSNQFAADSATRNFRDFFDRLEAYGLGVDPYFRAAKLPLKIAYRSGIVPGPGKDGRVVNARVYPDDWPADAAGPEKLGSRPGLAVHLAMANLNHRARKPWDGHNPSPAEPIGIAADARWIWHVDPDRPCDVFHQRRA